jgi:hypothetical protein
MELPGALSVAGNVIDVSTIEPFAGAQAVLSFPTAPAMHSITNFTDGSGNFVLISPTGPSSGFYNVTVSPAGDAPFHFHDAYDDNPHATLSIYAVPPGYQPPNDNFAQETSLNGNDVSLIAFNINATLEAGEPKNAGATGGASVWWKWTAPGNGTVVVDTIGSSFDTTLGIYTGSSVASLTAIATDDDHGGHLTSKLTFSSAVAGTSYSISVDGYGGDSGKINLHLHYTPGP